MEASCIFPIIFSLITLVIVLVEWKLNLIVKINYKFYLLLCIFKLMFFFFTRINQFSLGLRIL